MTARPATREFAPAATRLAGAVGGAKVARAGQFAPDVIAGRLKGQE
jgi:hypothetical protein